jgi:hypothetical protein
MRCRGWHFAEALADVLHAIELQPSLVAAHAGLGSLYFITASWTRPVTSWRPVSRSIRAMAATTSPVASASAGLASRGCFVWPEVRLVRRVYQKIPFVGGFVGSTRSP